jgi:hypothetical protein
MERHKVMAEHAVTKIVAVNREYIGDAAAAEAVSGAIVAPVVSAAAAEILAVVAVVVVLDLVGPRSRMLDAASHGLSFVVVAAWGGGAVPQLDHHHY